VLERIVKLAREEKIEAFVLGIPVPVHEEQPLVQLERVKAFAERLKEVTGLLVHEIDEVMTTREAKRVQSEYGSKVGEDALAAMMILQEYLDTL
jgi:putative transcription antitermination factor YqgF